MKCAEVSGGFRKTTNNLMEIYAAIADRELLLECMAFSNVCAYQT